MNCIWSASKEVPLLHLVLNYITHTVHNVAVVIISLHTRKYAILLHLAWLKSKKLDLTLFLLYFYESWAAAVVCDSVNSLLDSGWVYFLVSSYAVYSTVNCASATSYNCDATITFFLNAPQWTTNEATTINISCSAICAQLPIQLTGLLGVRMWHGDLTNFLMMHQHTEGRNYFPKKRGTFTEPLKLTEPH